MNGLALIAFSDRDLRAGARVLRGLLTHDHPMVQRAVTEALADSGRHQAFSCLARMESVLLGEEVEQMSAGSWWRRLKGKVQRFIERHIIADDPYGNWR